MSDEDDPWWALREILTTRAPELVSAIEGGLDAYSTGGRDALSAWLSLQLAPGPDDDPWWAMGEIVQAKDPASREMIADGLDAYATAGRQALMEWLAPGEQQEREGALHASAVFRGTPNAGDQSGKARVGFVVLIECVDEREQLARIARLLKDGIKCRALI